jgi:hypothetical protein
MTKIGDFFSWLFISLFLLWVGAMVFSSDKCTRVHRAAWPVTYSVGAVEIVSQNWTSNESKLSLLLFKAKSAVWAQETFEKTVYGVEGDKCSK